MLVCDFLWGAAPHPALLLKKEGRKLFSQGSLKLYVILGRKTNALVFRPKMT